MLSHLEIVMLSISDDTIEAIMPVDQRTMQLFGYYMVVLRWY